MEAPLLKDIEEFSITDKPTVEKELLCQICTKYLSVPPIHYSELLGNICGRCSHVAREANASRQLVFEKIAEFITFPCCNKKFGCDKILKWADVQTHEKSCGFQCSNCPLFYKQFFPSKPCCWVGNVKQLNEHIENMHKDLILDPPQLTWSETNTNSIFFTHVGDQLITVVLKYEKDSKYYCLLLFNGTDIESQCYRYQLELFDEAKENSLILRKSRLEPLGNILESSRCSEKMLEVDLTKIKEFLQNPKLIHARFGVVKKPKKEIAQIAGAKNTEILLNGPVTKEKVAPPDEEMLIELECPICNEFMTPPIYICQTGHSVCSECKAKVPNCPNCRGSYSGARNFTLEKLTAKVNYPCRNREIGCSFVSTSDKIRQHEGTCALSENHCILRCGWKGLCPGMYNHILERHPTMLLQHNTVIMREIKEKNVTHQVLYAMGELFRFTIRNSFPNGPLKFNMQHLGMVEGQSMFKYTVQFLDQGSNGLNLSLTNVCQCLTDNLNEALKLCITVPNEMIRPMIYEKQYFCYKIIITKI